MKTKQHLLVGSLLLVSCGPSEFDSSIPSRGKSVDGASSGDATIETPATVEKTFDLTTCGFDTEKPSSLALSQRLGMESFKKTITGSIFGGGVFTTKTDVTFNANLVMEASLTSHVLTYTGTYAPETVDASAVSPTLNNLKGATTANIIDTVSRSKIGETYSDWAGLFCSLQPAKQIASTAGRRLALTFSQPIPYGVLALGNLDRIKLELSKKRSFTKIEAKVTDSDDKAVAVGTVFKGTVTAELVPVTQIANAKGDIAIQIKYDFGGDDKLKLLGLPKSIIWVVNAASKNMGAIQIAPASGDTLTFR